MQRLLLGTLKRSAMAEDVSLDVRLSRVLPNRMSVPLSRPRSPSEPMQLYAPTVCVTQLVDVSGTTLSMVDTDGQESYDRLRPLSYVDTAVFLVCFGVDSPDSLANVEDRVSRIPFPEVLSDETKTPLTTGEGSGWWK